MHNHIFFKCIAKQVKTSEQGHFFFLLVNMVKSLARLLLFKINEYFYLERMH